MHCSLLLTALTLGQPPDTAAIDALMKEAVRAWDVPGAAVGIIHNDRIYLKGFGVQKLGSDARVTPDTVFPIASCTKSFTTLALAMLADEGKLAWDDRVSKHVPFFKLQDPLADANVTLRDLVTHRTGLGAHDPLWYRAPWSLEDRIKKLAHLKPSHSFRAKFEYQTTCFGAAGHAVGTASRSSWEAFLHKRIFAALDMPSASCTTAKALKRTDHASPHRKQNGKTEVIDWYAISEPDPAGSINASARDLLKFIRFQLGDGTWQGKRLISRANLAEPQTPQIVVRREGFARLMNPDTDLLTYGMGWIVQDYRGQLLVMHGGAIDGFRAHFTLVPKARLGFVLLNNLDRSQMNIAVSNSLVDLYLNLPYKDWNSYFREIMRAEEVQQKEMIRAWQEERKKGTEPSHALSDYVGVYEDPAYGAAKISLEKGMLVWQWSSYRVLLEHWHDDTFVGKTEEFRHVPFRFTLDRSGVITSLQSLEREFKRRK